ncbi:MAG: ABC transporter permease [Achromobacter mucicolens]
MTGFLIKRVMQAVFVIVAVTLLVSNAVRLTGDPALMLSQGSGSVTEQDLANIRQALGLNRPVHEQYLSYMQGLLHGDFGRSFMGGTSVAKLIGDALPATLMLAFTSLIVSILISLPLGIQAAIKRGKPTDQAIRILSLVGL